MSMELAQLTEGGHRFVDKMTSRFGGLDVPIVPPLDADQPEAVVDTQTLTTGTNTEAVGAAAADEILKPATEAEIKQPLATADPETRDRYYEGVISGLTGVMTREGFGEVGTLIIPAHLNIRDLRGRPGLGFGVFDTRGVHLAVISPRQDPGKPNELHLLYLDGPNDIFPVSNIGKRDPFSKEIIDQPTTFQRGILQGLNPYQLWGTGSHDNVSEGISVAGESGHGPMAIASQTNKAVSDELERGRPSGKHPVDKLAEADKGIITVTSSMFGTDERPADPNERIVTPGTPLMLVDHPDFNRILSTRAEFDKSGSDPKDGSAQAVEPGIFMLGAGLWTAEVRLGIPQSAVQSRVYKTLERL